MRRPKLDDVVIHHNDIGICAVDCSVIQKLWSNLWMLNQWNDEFRLVKFKRKDSPNCAIKVCISNLQARDIISRVGLVGTTHHSYASATTWRLPSERT